jgi:aryl-alcohol dehydrogenase-like predicted oxidoreductase
MPAAPARPANAAVQKLALGSGSFGVKHPDRRGPMTSGEAEATLTLAAEAGVRLIDTSARYGEAESLLGRFLRRGPDAPTPFGVVTKTIAAEGGGVAVELAARASLQRLQVEQGDAIVVHDAGDLLSAHGPDLWRRLRLLKDEGLYGAVGIAATTADDPVGLARRFKPDLMQLPVSMLDQRLVADRTLEHLADLGVEVHVRSVFHHGLLFAPRGELSPSIARCGPRLSRIRRTIAEAGADPMQAALAFALSLEWARYVIVGVASAAELRAVIAAAAAPTPRLDWSDLGLDDAEALDAAFPLAA